MKFTSSALLLVAAKASVIAAQELPITTTDVFIQSGEVSESSININARCNSEEDSKVVLYVDDVMTKDAEATSEDDFTITFEVDGLESNTKYSYVVTCDPLGADTVVATDAAYISMEGSFKTVPGADDEVAVNFVWAADLAGQGWGRNPDFEIVNLAGETIKGGYVVFDTMKSLNPDFALFQGDMVSNIELSSDSLGLDSYSNHADDTPNALSSLV
jgi:alkaline phosphatase D